MYQHLPGLIDFIRRSTIEGRPRPSTSTSSILGANASHDSQLQTSVLDLAEKHNEEKSTSPAIRSSRAAHVIVYPFWRETRKTDTTRVEPRSALQIGAEWHASASDGIKIEPGKPVSAGWPTFFRTTSTERARKW